METTTIRINRVTIHSFKNIRGLSFALFGGENLVVEGKNGLGKSNILNAIYWCINGKDLNGCSDNSNFIPFKNKELKVDVEVYTSVGKIERTVEVDDKGSLSQTVKLDDRVYTLIDFDIELDRRMGLLPFTLNSFGNKDFRLREFLMNPTYHLRLTPKAIRDVLAKRYSHEMVYREGFEIPSFNPLFIDMLKRHGVMVDLIRDFYPTIERVSTDLENKRKELRKAVDEELIVKRWLIQIDNVNSKLMDEVDYILNESKAALEQVEQDMMILDNGRQTWNECLEKFQNGSLKVKFQETTAKGTKKNTFAIEEDGFNLNHVSTSENTMDSLELADIYLKGIGCDSDLPIFIDRAESINTEKLTALRGRQLLMTKVTSGRKIKINGSEVQ